MRAIAVVLLIIALYPIGVVVGMGAQLLLVSGDFELEEMIELLSVTRWSLFAAIGLAGLAALFWRVSMRRATQP